MKLSPQQVAQTDFNLDPPNDYFDDGELPENYESAIDEINDIQISFFDAVQGVNEYGEDYFSQWHNVERKLLVENLSKADYKKAYKCYSILSNITDMHKLININEFMDWIIEDGFSHMEMGA